MELFILQKIGKQEKSKKQTSQPSFHRLAVKRIDDVFRTRVDAKRTLREITILRQCHHRNIAQLK